ncbi:hypothetical protein PAXRUDRAFT_340110 [Paxillus rubicundulus Ve08.2h10]|uniref:Unplaced genomic scaffold scaffold_1865, whole genome shotgun sequence n=1 Tax=Paxillus rubicundulus Ve08.2h10 TaxID=930991 RepID=A0A0D0D3N4_9AGAM|nr:hypothetical protein PAXRUDRAFT_340110 [Paxillus rubicundulus Ve08.2h10]
MCIFFILINGFQVFWNFRLQEKDFVASYINIPLFFCLYAYWKVTRKTRVRIVGERNFTKVCFLLTCCGRPWLTCSGKGIPSIAETETEYRRPHGFWERAADIVF